MKVQQVSISLGGNIERMAEIAQTLAENGINIRALTLAGSSEDPYTLRFLANDTERAAQILKESQFPVGIDEVCVIETPDKPGGLASILLVLQKVGICVEYLQAFSQRSGATGLVILSCDNLDAAIAVLLKYGVRVLSNDEVCAI